MDEFEQTRKTYNEIAELYNNKRLNLKDSPWNYYLEMPVMKSALNPIVQGKKVLDLGCGSGLLTQEINKWGGLVQGVDISEEMIKLARTNYPNIKFNVGNSNSLPCNDSEFDIVSSSLVMHYIQDLLPSFIEVSRVLKKNGQFIFSMHHPMQESFKLDKSSSGGAPLLQPYFHNNHYYWQMCGKELLSFHHTFENIIQSLKNAGFLLMGFRECRPSEDSKDIFADYKFTSQYPTFCLFHACWDKL